MSFANLSRIGLDKPLRLLLVHAGDAESITWAGLVQPLRLHWLLAALMVVVLV